MVGCDFSVPTSAHGIEQFSREVIETGKREGYRGRGRLSQVIIQCPQIADEEAGQKFEETCQHG